MHMNLLYAQHLATAGGLGGCAIAIQNPAAPPLKVTSTGERATLSWPDAGSSYVLETIDSLSSPARWVPVMAQARNEVSIKLGVSNRFFRLARK